MFHGNTTLGSPIITSADDTSSLVIGQHLSATNGGIATNARIVSIVTNTSVTMDKNGWATGSGVEITQFWQHVNAEPQSSSLVVVALAVSSLLGLTAIPVSAVSVEAVLSGSAVECRATPSSEAQASAVLAGSLDKLYGNPTSSMDALCSLYGSTASMSGTPSSAFVANSSLSGSTAAIYASPASQVVIAPWLSGATFSINAKPVALVSGSANLTGASDTHGMSVCDVVKEILALWDIYDAKSAPTFTIERAVNDLNASLQMVWNHADDRNYWSNDTLTIAISDGEDTFDLPDDIQNVVGPCRLASNLRPLVPLGTLGELETFADLYLDGETSADPLAYHINRMSQAGSDPAKCVFCVTPSVTGATMSFLLEVVREAPRFTVNDMIACPVVPIPHRYVESLLLPVARYHASSFSLFSAKELKESIDRDYLQARVALGLSDPLPGKAGDNIDRRDEKKS